MKSHHKNGTKNYCLTIGEPKYENYIKNLAKFYEVSFSEMCRQLIKEAIISRTENDINIMKNFLKEIKEEEK